MGRQAEGVIPGLQHQQEQVSSQRRRQLYDLRDWYRPHAMPRVNKKGEQVDGMRGCGRTRVALDAALVVREGEIDEQGERPRSASWNGVRLCESAWSCPVCLTRRRVDRARAIECMDRHVRAMGWGLAMLTLTTRHAHGDDLRETRQGMARAWGAVQSRAAWQWLLNTDCPHCPAGDDGKPLQAGVDCEHVPLSRTGAFFIRALEVTHGSSGWHAHYHILILTERPMEPWERDAYEQALYEDWAGAIVAQLRPSAMPDRKHGAKLTPCFAGDYLSKLDLHAGDELTDATDHKRARRGNRKPMHILRDAHSAAMRVRADERATKRALRRGEPDPTDYERLGVDQVQWRKDVELYREYERGMFKAALHTASQGLLAFWQAVADAERDEYTDTLHTLTIPGDVFDALRQVDGGLSTLVDLAELLDPHEAIPTWLRSLGTTWVGTRTSYTSRRGDTVVVAQRERWDTVSAAARFSEMNPLLS